MNTSYVGSYTWDNIEYRVIWDAEAIDPRGWNHPPGLIRLEKLLPNALGEPNWVEERGWWKTEHEAQVGRTLFPPNLALPPGLRFRSQVVYNGTHKTVFGNEGETMEYRLVYNGGDTFTVEARRPDLLGHYGWKIPENPVPLVLLFSAHWRERLAQAPF
jgi:hypothetical protein